MEEQDIGILSNGGQVDEVAEILRRFLKNNENVFTFPSLSQNNHRVLLWTSLFQHLQTNDSAAVHTLCLAAIRILGRDKTDLESMICEKWINVLVERAGLYNFVDLDDESMVPVEIASKDVAVEALKCLCNITYQSEVARVLCAHTDIAQGLISRLRVYKDIPYKEDLMLYDMKLLFILTALREDIKLKIKDEYHGMDYLTSTLNELMLEATMNQIKEPQSSSVEGVQDRHCWLNYERQAIVCEILKAQFNLILNCGSEDPGDEAEETMYLKLMPGITAVLLSFTNSTEKLMELHSNVANLLTSVPSRFYIFLTPELTAGEIALNKYDNRNMDALQALVNLLRHKLTLTTGVKNQYESLSPILTVMNKCARGCRTHRKYLRSEVLPPLVDVDSPPEKGQTLRNQLCRLLTTPVTTVRDLVAEFLFVLCKEKVSRLVKYTGFGNAAGHLAQKGLLSGGRPGQYSSSSEDSDTEEYREAADRIDPVVGCVRPPRFDPFEGMSEEQKEYEAMRLVNLFDRMVTAGVVVPARVGPDGRPQAASHVMELREEPPNRPKS